MNGNNRPARASPKSVGRCARGQNEKLAVMRRTWNQNGRECEGELGRTKSVRVLTYEDN